MELAKAIKRAKRVYLAGNGGSAANAIHLANDLISVGIKAQALTGDVATITAIANDFGYTAIFSRQLLVFGEPGDLLIAFSGSGSSPNILSAITAAHAKYMDTWAIVGLFTEGMPPAARLAKNCTCEGIDMQDAENAQLKLGHRAMRWLKTNHSPVDLQITTDDVQIISYPGATRS